MKNSKKMIAFAAAALLGTALIGGTVLADGAKGGHMMGGHMGGQMHGGGYGHMGEEYKNMTEEQRTAFQNEMHAVMEKYMPGFATEHGNKDCNYSNKDAK